MQREDVRVCVCVRHFAIRLPARHHHPAAFIRLQRPSGPDEPHHDEQRGGQQRQHAAQHQLEDLRRPRPAVHPVAPAAGAHRHQDADGRPPQEEEAQDRDDEGPDDLGE